MYLQIYVVLYLFIYNFTKDLMFNDAVLMSFITIHTLKVLDISLKLLLNLKSYKNSTPCF
jgi:hypothetical protein